MVVSVPILSRLFPSSPSSFGKSVCSLVFTAGFRHYVRFRRRLQRRRRRDGGTRHSGWFVALQGSFCGESILRCIPSSCEEGIQAESSVDCQWETGQMGSESAQRWVKARLVSSTRWFEFEESRRRPIDVFLRRFRITRIFEFKAQFNEIKSLV